MLISDLSIVVRGSEIFLSRCLSEFDITATEQIILLYLYGHDKPNQGEIAKYYMIDKGSVAKTLQKLESKAFITRSVKENNQRKKVITLTEKAYRVKDVCVKYLKIWNEMLYKDIPEEDIETFSRIAAKMAANVAASLDNREDLYGK